MVWFSIDGLNCGSQRTTTLAAWKRFQLKEFERDCDGSRVGGISDRNDHSINAAQYVVIDGILRGTRAGSRASRLQWNGNVLLAHDLSIEYLAGSRLLRLFYDVGSAVHLFSFRYCPSVTVTYVLPVKLSLPTISASAAEELVTSQ